MPTFTQRVQKQKDPAGRVVLSSSELVAGLPKFGSSSADVIAASMGFQSRYQLAHALKAAGLPELRTIRQWAQLLEWLRGWERDKTSLARGALSSLHDPATRYRLVRRLTGRPWRQVQALGSAWAVTEFISRCDSVSSVRRNEGCYDV